VSYAAEFLTVDAVLGSPSVTRAVDAFALSVIKAERQIRKIFTHLVYQSPAFGPDDVEELRQTLWKSRRVYFEGFVSGVNAVSLRSVKELVGEEHDRLLGRLKEATRHRNKIFHGQLTSESLRRDAIMGYVLDIREWCERLAVSASVEFRYDGFGRNSFRKSKDSDLWKRLRVQYRSVDEYAAFIREHMSRSGPCVRGG